MNVIIDDQYEGVMINIDDQYKGVIINIDDQYEGVMARSLKDLIGRAKDKLQYGDWCQVMIII